MKTTRYFVLLLLGICGCATTANIQPEKVAVDRSEGQFVPVQAFYNRNLPVPRFYLNRLEAVEAALKESGAFFDMGPLVNSPVILDIELQRGTHDSAVDTAGQILSAATLFLVPTKVDNYNELKVSVYAYGKLLKSYEFKQDYTQVLGLHNFNEVASNEDNEFLSIRNLVNQFVNELEADALLPKVRLDESGRPVQQQHEGFEQEADRPL